MNKTNPVNPATPAVSLLNDFDIWQLDDYHWRFYVEFCVIANACNDDRWFHSSEIGWMLRRSPNDVHQLLSDLCCFGLTTQRGKNVDAPGGWRPLLPETFISLPKDESNTSWQSLRKFVFDRDGGICVYCGSTALAIDHIIPRNLGGKDESTNLVASCKSCNSSKGTKMPYEWFREHTHFNDTRLAYIKAVQDGRIKDNGDAVLFMEQTDAQT